MDEQTREPSVVIRKYADDEAVERDEPFAVETYERVVDEVRHAAWETTSTVTKYIDDDAVERGDPYAVDHYEGNVGLNEGLAMIWQLVAGLGGTAFGATALLRVGSDSATAEAATQTGLIASLGSVTVTAAPTAANQSMTWVGSFGAGTATGTWAEWTIENTVGTNLNRRVQAMGTKGAGETWTLSATLTLA